MSEDLPPLPRSFRYLVLTRAGEGFGDSLAGTIMPILAVSVLGLGTVMWVCSTQSAWELFFCSEFLSA